MSYKFSPEQWNFQLRHQLKNSRYVGSQAFQDTVMSGLSNSSSRAFSGTVWTYVTVPSSNGNFGFGTGDFTVECWVLLDSKMFNNDWRQQRALIESRVTTTNETYFYFTAPSNEGEVNLPAMWNGVAGQGGTYDLSVARVPTRVWTHVAWCRKSGILRIFVNGKVALEVSNNWNLPTASSTFIGADPNSASRKYFGGRISNLRVVKGVGLYDQAFAPPVGPLSAVTGTTFLCFNEDNILDRSPSPVTLTQSGTSSSIMSPFIPRVNTNTTGPDGNLYGTPGGAGYTIDMVGGNVVTATRGGLSSKTSAFGYTSSVVYGDTIIHVPAGNSDFLFYNTKTGVTTSHSFGLTYGSVEGHWFADAHIVNDKLWCIPRDANYIAVVDLRTMTATAETFGLSLVGDNKWSASVMSNDFKIYCVPFNATDMLIIDTRNYTATRETLGYNFTGTRKYHGAFFDYRGDMYLTPFDVSKRYLLKVSLVSMFASDFISGYDFGTTDSKSVGVKYMPDGSIWMISFGPASTHWRIDPLDMTVTTVPAVTGSAAVKMRPPAYGTDGQLISMPGNLTFPAAINRDFERITFSNNNMSVIERISPWFNR